MWWRKKEKAAEPFTGSAYDSVLAWCQTNGERIEILTPDAFDLYLKDNIVHVERHDDDDWLYAWTVLPESIIARGESVEEKLKAYETFTDRQLKNLDIAMDLQQDGSIRCSFTKLARYQGNMHWMNFNMVSTFEYLLYRDESKTVPSEEIYFYVNGKRFVSASDAAQYYMRSVRRDRIIEEAKQYVSFDSGGVACAVATNTLPHEFTFRFAFSEFMRTYKGSGTNLNAQLFAAAYRKPPYKIASYVFDDGLSELSISGVLTAGTEARPVFTRTLAEIYQVVLDSTERIAMNPGLLNGTQLLNSEEESIRQARKYHGEKTGGAD